MADIVLFVVRVWRQQPFRAAVRPVNEEAPHCFSAPEQLADFFRDAAQTSGEAEDVV